MRETRVRRLCCPYPYRSILAICSDLDETPTFERYVEASRFLNTAEETSAGPGVDLEVGNTIYFDMDPSQFSFWNATDAQRETVRALIRSGHVDCFHSFGDLATSREHARRALADLEANGCRIPVWIDHAVAPTNFGADIMQGSGDVPGAEAYHADLTLRHGVRYVWTGRVTSVTGQNVPRRLDGLFSPREPLRSGKTWLKEFAKGLLARLPGSRYAMHRHNRVLAPVTLRDGQAVTEFLRCNPHRGGVSAGDRGDRIGEVLTGGLLDRLEAKGGVAILYTHLGKVTGDGAVLPDATVCALRELARRYAAGRVLVATTARVLDFCALGEGLSWRQAVAGGRLAIDLRTTAGSLEGLAFTTDWEGPIDVSWNGRTADGFEIAAGAGRGERVVHWPWRRLPYPPLPPQP